MVSYLLLQFFIRIMKGLRYLQLKRKQNYKSKIKFKSEYVSRMKIVTRNYKFKNMTDTAKHNKIHLVG